MSATSKRLLISESHGDSNRCTPYRGKTRPTQYVRFPRQSMHAQRMFPVGGPRTRQAFMSHRQSWTESLLLRKKGSRHNPQHVG
jgi:hypothetical protein